MSSLVKFTRINSKLNLPTSKVSLFWKYFFVLFTVFTLLFVLSASCWYQINLNQNKQGQIKQSSTILKFHSGLIHKEIATIVADLQILSSLPLFEESMRQEELNDVSEQLEISYLAFMRSRLLYDQLRFIDLNGNERVRISRNSHGAFVSPPQSLQNKSLRYYFYEARHLMPGEVFISRLDLNIENGVVELPIKPMLRLATLLYQTDKEEGRKPSGIVVANYLAENILRLLNENKVPPYSNERQHDLMIADSFGYWLGGRPEEQLWGFMFDRPDQNIKVQKSELWEAMQKSDQGAFEDKDGVYSFHFVPATSLSLSTGEQFLESFSLIPSQQVGKDYGWYLIDFQSQDTFSHNVQKNLFKGKFVWLLFFVMGILLPSFLAYYLANRQLVRDQIQFLAYHDGLTGVLSRSAWNQQLVPQLNALIENGKSFLIAYLDVNDFKFINDSYGHDVGDEILKITSQRLIGTVRSEDVVVRLGGDEFLVVFASDNPEQDSDILMSKLKTGFSEPMRVNKYTLNISVSVGIAKAPDDARSLDGLLSKADERMYKDKASMKQSLG